MRSNARPGLCRRFDALADVRAHQRDPVVGAEHAHPLEQLRLGQPRVRVTDRGEHLVLAVGIPVDEADLVRRLRALVAEEPLRRAAWVSSRVAARYFDHAPPRSGRSTRTRNDGMTLRSSSSISWAYICASGSGWARMRRSSASNAWPVP